MPILADKEKCCGCAACYSICPSSAITMLPDETGFLYPDINEEICVECKQCETVCPTQDILTAGGDLRRKHLLGSIAMR